MPTPESDIVPVGTSLFFGAPHKKNTHLGGKINRFGFFFANIRAVSDAIRPSHQIISDVKSQLVKFIFTPI
jgi:hypothetical protein